MFLESELTGKHHDQTVNLRAKHSGTAKEGRTYAIDATSVPMLPGTSPRTRQQPLQCHTIKTRRCKQKGIFLIIDTDAFKPPFLLTTKSILVRYVASRTIRVSPAESNYGGQRETPSDDRNVLKPANFDQEKKKKSCSIAVINVSHQPPQNRLTVLGSAAWPCWTESFRYLGSMQEE